MRTAARSLPGVISSRSYRRPIPLVALLLVVALLPACAATQNTIAQELAWERWKKCDKFPTVTLKDIKPDGQIWVYTHYGSDLAAWRECDRAAQAEQASRRIAVATPTGVAEAKPPASVSAAASTATLARPVAVKPGSEWAYRWETPSGKGTFVYVLDRQEVKDGSTWYVVKSGTREMYWRTDDLAHSIEAVAGEVEMRRSPPMEVLRWPLTAGTEWDQTYTLERPKQRQTDEVQMSCRIEGEESVVVPAGAFRAFKSVCHNKRTRKMFYSVWYAPEVGSFVRDVSLLSSGEYRERELIQFRLRP